MDLPALERALAASEARPLLVDARLVRRVIKRHRHLPGVGLQVPHARCYAIGREALLELCDASELGRAAADLPEQVILLPRPEPDDAGRRPLPETLGELWRYAFHARVHQEIDRLAAAGTLTPARVRERIHRIGQTEFDEIRLVLRQDRLLLPPRDDLGTYAEFAALYLELKTFAPAVLTEIFPTLVDAAAAEEALGADLDVARLLEATRPEGAQLPTGEPEAAGEGEADGDEDGAPEAGPAAGDEAIVAEASAAARARGNTARSALLNLRAGRESEAAADARTLAERLARAVRPAGDATEKGSGLEVALWSKALLGLAKHAIARGGLFRRVEARLLYDVQSACLAGEKAIGKVSLVDWALSLGKRPLARLLPATREIRVAHHLADAAGKVPRVGLPEAERAGLRELLAGARRHADEALREELRPVVQAALREVGFRPASTPERVAMAKVVEELLDEACSHGHLGLGMLRDAISRNQLKMADLSGAGELLGADALLAADRRLGVDLDGVHRRGEIYLRALQKGSSLLFGTASGRWLTFYVLLPVGGGYMLPFATPLIINEFAHLARLAHLLPEGPPELHPHHHHLEAPSLPWVVACSVVLFGLIHSHAVRTAALTLLRVVGSILHAILIRAPLWILSRPLVRALLGSRVALALGRFVIKPAAVAAAAAGAVTALTDLRIHHRHHLLAHLPTDTRPVAAVVFVVSAVAFNTRAGILAEEMAIDALVRTARRVQRDVLPGFFRLIAGFFRGVTDTIDRGIYTVDEWLRFRSGQSRGALAAKGVLGVAWFAIAYLLRVLVNLFLEPTINPLKHFPTVTVAAKVMWATVGPPLHAALAPVFGPLRAGTLTGLAMALLPGFFGFLVWELKENYKLYQATRAAALQPVAIGHHGETMGGLLRPGLHSGTLPKLWAKLRRAVRKGDGLVEKHREAMREIEEAVERFVERELGELLAESDRWEGGVHVARVALASNRVRVDLRRGHDGSEICAVSFEEQSGWLVAGLAHPGWAASLSGDERVIFENAIGGLYQRAGVDLVREQIAAALPGAARYDIADEGLVVWPAGFATELVYDLSAKATLKVQVRGEPPAAAPPAIERSAIVFREQGIRWAEWVEAWSGAPRRIVKGASLLPPPRGETFRTKDEPART